MTTAASDVDARCVERLFFQPSCDRLGTTIDCNMAIGFLPSRYPSKRFLRLADEPLNAANWPLDDKPDATTFGELTERDHLIMTLNSRSAFANLQGLRCRVSLRMIEPPAIHGRYYKLVPWIAHRYHRVLTHSTALLEKLPNARFMPHGDTFLDEPSTGNHPKSRRVSMIASAKRYAPGHKLRHRIAEWSKQEDVDLNLYGYGYRPLDDKRLGHDPYYYSVVLENSREAGYFTEKLVDSLLCSSLPIYWGAPDIAHFFDPRGMIICHTEQQIRDAIRNADEAGYTARAPYLAANRERALHFAQHQANAARVLLAEDEVAQPATRHVAA